eukprot:3084601-Pyramimonas_sp.AAC.1
MLRAVARTLSGVMGAWIHLVIFFQRILSLCSHSCLESKPTHKSGSNAMAASFVSGAIAAATRSSAGMRPPIWRSVAHQSKGGHTLVHLFHAGGGGG